MAKRFRVGVNGLAVLITLVSASFPVSTAGKMVRMERVPIQTVITALEKNPAHETLPLARIARRIGVEFIDMAAFKANERFFQTLDAQYIAQEIQSHVLSLKDWNAKVAGASEKSTQDARPVLKKALTEQSPSWAWFLNQWGERAAAKNILLADYDHSYREVMSQKQYRSESFSRAEAVLRALETMANPSEKEALQEKFRKMKVHVSRLPSAHIVT